MKAENLFFSPIPSGIRKLFIVGIDQAQAAFLGGYPWPESPDSQLPACPGRPHPSVISGEIPTAAAVGCKGSSLGPQKLQLFDIVRSKAGGMEGLRMKGRAQRKADPGMSARYSVGNRLS